MLINITKKLVLVFIIGVLVGAIIATAGFLIYSKFCKTGNAVMTPPGFSQSENSGMPGFNDGNSNGNFKNKGKRPQMPNGNQGGNKESDQTQIPELPNAGNQSGQQPEAPNSGNSDSIPELPNTNNS